MQHNPSAAPGAALAPASQPIDEHPGIHRQRRRIFPRLDRQRAAQRHHPGLYTLGAAAHGAVFLQPHAGGGGQPVEFTAPQARWSRLCAAGADHAGLTTSPPTLAGHGRGLFLLAGAALAPSSGPAPCACLAPHAGAACACSSTPAGARSTSPAGPCLPLHWCGLAFSLRWC